MRKMAIVIVILVLIVAGVGSGFLIADYNYQKGYSKGYDLGYSKGHFEGFIAGEALESDCWMCELIARDIAYTDNDYAPQGVIIPYSDDNTNMSWCHSLQSDPRFRWDTSWVYAGYECTEHRNEIVDLYRENQWSGYIK